MHVSVLRGLNFPRACFYRWEGDAARNEFVIVVTLYDTETQPTWT